jgi:uncharacterized protein (TIRG00374 family)
MVIVYHHTNWDEELPRILKTPWYFILAAVVTDIAVYCVQGWRWNELLKPVGSIPVWHSIQAIYVGLFANEVVPAKPGELIRSFLRARWSGVPFSVVLSSVVIERLFDGIWLILGFFLTSLFIQLPTLLVIGSRILGVILLLITVVLGTAILRRKQVEKWLSPKFIHLLDALESMGRSGSFYNAFAISLLYLLLQIGPIYFIQHGYGLNLSFGACAAILVILRLGSIPPQGPGNVGAFQLLAALGAVSFGVEKGQAAGFANLLFIVITAPLWLAGFVALLATKMKLSHLMQAVDQ